MNYTIEYINSVINSFVWGPVMLCVFILIGLMFSIRTNFFQITHIKLWLSKNLRAIISPSAPSKKDGSISQFQSLCTVLAATIGTGNIAGVATAIVCGGPGSIFWMWISALLGMMTAFAENVLGIKYRYKNKQNEWIGGPMIYIERGLKVKWLAVMFCVFCLLATFGMGNMTQINSICNAMKSTFNIPNTITAVILVIVLYLVIFGGIKRIASFTSKLVPVMALFYIIGSITIILFNYNNISDAFSLIFHEAFNFKSAISGGAGYGIAVAIQKGISRGVFSNEAGLGSSVMINSSADVKEPVVQGMLGIFEVFFDTIIICTLTALAILTSGSYDIKQYTLAMLTSPQTFDSLPSGIELAINSFSTVFGEYGAIFITISTTFFAFATLIGWSYYGERCIQYLFGDKWIRGYKFVFLIVTLIGSSISLKLVWDISDTFNGLMAIPNLIGITLLSGEVIKSIKHYLNQV